MYGYGYRYNSGLVLGAGGGAPFLNTYSLDFDGMDDKVSIGTALDLGINSTLSFWIKRGRVSTSEIWFGEDSYSSDYLVTITSSTILYFRINTSYVGWNYPAVKTILNNTTQWVNVCIVRSGNSVELFLNGISYGTGNSNAGTPGSTVTRFDTIGASPYGLHTFAQFDEIAAWNNNTVSAVDIYNEGTPTDLTDLSPISYYRMGDNGAWKSPQWLLPNNENKDKVSNYSLSFDGMDDKIELGTQSLGITGAISVSAWVKIPTTNTGGGGTNIQEIVCEDRASGTNRNWALNWRGGGLNQINAVIFDSGGGAIVATTTAIVPNDGNWHHLIFTYTGDTSTDGLKLFVDGIQRAQATSANGGLRSTTAVVPTIGGLSQTIQWMFEGNIDEVSIFNTDQSSNVSSIYNGGEPTTISGAVAHYKMGEEATFSGGVWTVPDQVGSNNGTSNAMTIEDRVGNAPNSENNALSFNMDLVDRTTDVPT